MSGRINRPDPDLTIANLSERIRILESIVPVASTDDGAISVCCITPLDGLTISDCSIVATATDGPYKDSFSVNTGGRFFNILEGQSPDFFEMKDTCAGQSLYVRGYLTNCTGLTPFSTFEVVNVLGTHNTGFFPILPGATPVDGSMLPWVALGIPSGGGIGSTIDCQVIIDLQGIFFSGVRAGDYWFEWAWFDTTSVQNPDLADSPINPGAQFGQLAVWNGLAWAPFPNGTAGQVLTMSGGVPTWV